MNDQDKEDYGKLFSRYTEISEDFSEQGKNSLFESPKKNTNKIHEDDNNKGFGDFVLMMDNKDEYKKTVLDNATKKVWNAIHKIKNTQNLSKVFKDPSKTKWYIINPDQNKYKPIFDSLFCLLLYADFIFSPFEYFVYQGSYKPYRIIIFDILFTI